MKDTREVVTVRLPSTLKERLIREAARRDVSVNRLVELALSRQLPAWENDPAMEGR